MVQMKFLMLIYILALTFGEAVWGAGLQFLIQGSEGLYNLPSSQSGLYAVAFFSGQLVSCLMFGYLADKSGRRHALLCTMSLTLFAGFFTTLAPVSHSSPFGFVPLLLFCVLQGFGVGGAIPVTQSLVVECFQVHNRGFYTCLASLGWPIGSLITTVLAWLIFPNVPTSSTSLSPSTSFPEGWTLVLLTQTSSGANYWPYLYIALSALHLVVLLLVYMYLPESPKFKKKGSSIMDQTDRTDSSSPSIKRSPSITISSSLCKTFLLLGIVWFAVSSSGNGFSTYLPILLSERAKTSNHTAPHGLPEPSVFTSLILFSAIGVPGVIAAAYAVESAVLGRKWVVFGSTFSAAVSFMVFLFSSNTWVVVAASCVQNFVVQISWASVVCLTSEAPPTTHRARVVGGANFIKAFSGIFGPYICGVFASSDPSLPILCFAAVMFAASFAACLLPQDKRGMELIDSFEEDGGGETIKGDQMQSPLL